MVRFDFQSKLLIAFICMLIVGMRMSGAHVHLCFDGKEPAASMHFEDGENHHANNGEDAATEHLDMDLSLVSDALVKADTQLSLLDFFAALTLLLLLLPRLRASVPIPAHVESFTPTRLYLCPPLRGPPR